MAKDRTIAEAMMEDIASMVDSPFEYVMVLCGIGFGKVFSEREGSDPDLEQSPSGEEAASSEEGGMMKWDEDTIVGGLWFLAFLLWAALVGLRLAGWR